MRKELLLIIALILLCLCSYAYAGDMHYLNFDDSNIITLTMAERDVARFNFMTRTYYEPYVEGGKERLEWIEEEDEQAFMLRDVRERQYMNETFDVADITLFVEDAETPQYNTMVGNTVLNIDFDRDRVNDMEVRLIGVDDDSGNATFEFRAADKTNAVYKPMEFVSRSGIGNKTTKTDSGNETESAIAEGKNDIVSNNYFARAWEKITSNIELSIIIAIIILILLLNRRLVERYLRRIL